LQRGGKQKNPNNNDIARLVRDFSIRSINNCFRLNRNRQQAGKELNYFHFSGVIGIKQG
jgi:hypothetical protein